MSGQFVLALVLPAGATVAVLTDANSNVHPHMWQPLQPLAGRLSLRLKRLPSGRKPVRAPLADAFDDLVWQKVDGNFVLPQDPFFFARRAETVALASRHRMPGLYGLREFVDAVGLTRYGESMVAAYRGVGGYIGKTLAGTKPVDLPVTPSTVFEVVIKLKIRNPTHTEISKNDQLLLVRVSSYF